MDKKKLILEILINADYTINQVIKLIWLDDLGKGGPEGIVEIGPFKWVHLNKLFDPMKEKGLIDHNGTFTREKRRDEKVWTITEAGKEYIGDFSSLITSA